MKETHEIKIIIKDIRIAETYYKLDPSPKKVFRINPRSDLVQKLIRARKLLKFKVFLEKKRSKRRDPLALS